ncbi:MAG: glycosyltransferase family 2 protein [Lachnospiraceae bacterium]|nr:glycosyltransferase family 2 protein [Lachnospiraceae bacterium]MBP5254501.1 glycosyltransferase family 2 protein [Lachnospiraceae bacterium]
MKKISVVIPCYNEEENVEAIAAEVGRVFREQLGSYDYEIIFIDNDSQDRTRDLLRLLVKSDPKIKAILNAKNFGQFNSPYYGLLQITGDAGILLACDFQDPVELIPEFVKGWEEGYKIVIGRKTKSKENPFVYFLRGIYYKLIKKFSEVDQIEQFTGFGLYDRAFVEVLKELDDPTPFLRGIVAEMGFHRKEIEYTQPERRAGKTSNNWYRLFDAAMLSVTSYTKIGLRMATFIGGFGALISFVIAIVFLVKKLTDWYGFEAGIAPLIILVAILGSLQLLFIGLIGEYILTINQRVMNRPLVVEEERIGCWDDEGPEEEGTPVTARTAKAARRKASGETGPEGEEA